MGKRRIEIKKIECPKALQVCFSKRRQGLFKKAEQLSVLCGVEVLVIAFSPAGKPFTFASSSFPSSECTPEALISRYLQSNSSFKPSSSSAGSVHESVVHKSSHNLHEEEEEEGRVPDNTLSLYESHLEDLKHQRQVVANRLQENATRTAMDSLVPFNDHAGLSEFKTFKNPLFPSIQQERDWGFPVTRDSSVLEIDQEMEKTRSIVVGDDTIANPIAFETTDGLFCSFEQSDAGFGFDFAFECDGWGGMSGTCGGAESTNGKQFF